MNKLLGYILSAIGLAGIGISYKAVRDQLGFPTLPSILSDWTIMIIAIILIVIGIIILRKGPNSSKQAAEVPIYHGKNIVGYRKLR